MPDEVEQMLRERISGLRDDLRRHERALAALSPSKSTGTTRKRRSSSRRKKNGNGVKAPSAENIALVRDYMLEHRGEEIQAGRIAEAVGLSAGRVSAALQALAADADSLIKHNGKGGAYSAYTIPAQEEVVA